MNASEGEASKTLFQKVEKELIKQVMLILHNEGRIMPFDELGNALLVNHGHLLELLLMEDPFYNLAILVRRCPHVFYDLLYGSDHYVSLSRDFTSVIPRLAKALENVHDKKRESVLLFKGLNKTKLPNYTKQPKRFHEYEFAKCSLALLEIFNTVIRSVAKDRNKVPLQRVIDKYSTLSRLGKSAVDFFSPASDAFQEFLATFDYFFKMNNSLLTVDFYLLDGYMMSLETDLVWSYAGHCVCKGLISIDDLVGEVNAFIQRAKLSFVKELTKPNLMLMLQCRRNLFFLPGDNTVWMMDPCSNFNKQQLLDLEDFWCRFLGRKRIHYTECLDIFLRRLPEKAEQFENESFLTIASHLYSLPQKFKFNNGMISLIRDDNEIFDIPEMCPVDVPTNLNFYSRHVRTISSDVIGYVKEVGIKSCIISFEDSFVAENAILTSEDTFPVKADAFCNTDTTIYQDERITDFTDILKKGDTVKFLYDCPDKPYIFCPLLIRVHMILPLNETGIILRSKQCLERLISDLSEVTIDSDSETD